MPMHQNELLPNRDQDGGNSAYENYIRAGAERCVQVRTHPTTTSILVVAVSVAVRCAGDGMLVVVVAVGIGNPGVAGKVAGVGIVGVVNGQI